MFVVLYQDAYKPRRGKIMGVYDDKEKAIELLLSYITDGHNHEECDCEFCEDYDIFKKDLNETGTVLEYSIHEIEFNKDF